MRLEGLLIACVLLGAGCGGDVTARLEAGPDWTMKYVRWHTEPDPDSGPAADMYVFPDTSSDCYT